MCALPPAMSQFITGMAGHVAVASCWQRGLQRMQAYLLALTAPANNYWRRNSPAGSIAGHVAAAASLQHRLPCLPTPSYLAAALLDQQALSRALQLRKKRGRPCYSRCMIATVSIAPQYIRHEMHVTVVINFDYFSQPCRSVLVQA